MIAKAEPAALLECTYVRRNGAGIVRVSGEIDLPNVHLLAEMLDAALGDRRTIIVDLAGVSTIDSTGLNVLIRVHERCALRQANMAVVFSVWDLPDGRRGVAGAVALGRAPPSSRGRRASVAIGNRD